MFFDLDLVAEAHDISHADPVDNLRRSEPVDLLGEDMVKPFRIIGEEPLHSLAVVQALYDLRDVHSGLHIHVDEGLVRVVVAAGVLLLEPVDHVFDRGAGREQERCFCLCPTITK